MNLDRWERLIITVLISACPERGPVRLKQYEEASPKCAPSVRFRYVRGHFGRRRNNALGSFDPFPGNLYKRLFGSVL